MARMPLVISVVLLVLCPWLCAGNGGEKPKVEDVVKNMQAFYNETRDIKGKFKQVYSDTLYNHRKTSYGYLYVKKPGMMRWNYVKPDRMSFIADGKTLWVWEPEDKQAFKNPLDTRSLSTGLTFLLGTGDISKEFSISYSTEKMGAPGDLVLKLLPKVPTAQYDYLLIAITPRDYSVGESMVVAKQSKNHFIFSTMLVNTGLSASRFQFTPPEGTRVIDGSKLKARP